MPNGIAKSCFARVKLITLLSFNRMEAICYTLRGNSIKLAAKHLAETKRAEETARKRVKE
jgi:hypothetical protein